MLIEYKENKLFAFADTHGMYRRLFVPTKADIGICAGDGKHSEKYILTT